MAAGDSTATTKPRQPDQLHLSCLATCERESATLHSTVLSFPFMHIHLTNHHHHLVSLVPSFHTARPCAQRMPSMSDRSTQLEHAQARGTTDKPRPEDMLLCDQTFLPAQSSLTSEDLWPPPLHMPRGSTYPTATRPKQTLSVVYQACSRRERAPRNAPAGERERSGGTAGITTSRHAHHKQEHHAQCLGCRNGTSM